MCCSGNGDSTHLGIGAPVGGVGHRTHVNNLVVACARRLRVEGDAVAVHREVGHINLRQDEGHLCRIAGAGGAVEIEGTAASVRIGGVAVRICGTRSGTRSDIAVAAPRQSRSCSGALNLVGLEAASPRQALGSALGAVGDGRRLGSIFGRAVCHNAE